MGIWQLQEAKSKLSQVINLALEEGPQEVTKNGKTAVYIISSDEYERTRKPSFKQVLSEFPGDGVLDFSRIRDGVREMDL